MPALTWNERIAALPGAHVLQTAEWAALKSRFGWQPLFAGWGPDGRMRMQAGGFTDQGELRAAALLLKRTIPIPGFSARLCVLYAPRGPLLDWQDAGLRTRVLDDLEGLARAQGAIFLKVDPDVALAVGQPGQPDDRSDPAGQAVRAELERRSWLFSSDQIQFRNTVVLDLRPDEDALLAGMKQKARYNINLARKKGVTVRHGTPADIHLLYRMYAETSVRDGFTIRSEEYYRTCWELFMNAADPHADALVAEVEGSPVSALLLFTFARRAWYLFGMSTGQHREKMPNHLLQWQAVLLARRRGCLHYDLWGAPDVFAESDPLWGVYRFKEGLGGAVRRGLGAWDAVPHPWQYDLYTRLLPHLLNLMRRRGNQQTRQSLAG